MLEQILATEYYGNLGSEYLIALGVFFATILGFWVFKNYLLHVLAKAATKSQTKIDDQIIEILNHVPKVVYIVLGIFVSTRTLQMPQWLSNSFWYLLLIAGIYYVVKVAQLFVDLGIEHMSKRGEEETQASLLNMLGRIIKGVLWAIAILVILANFGVEITPLIAGMGIGGLAIAFAFQNILEDLFSSFSIYFDEPFEVGDFIIVGDDMGVVKYIGLKTTRLTTLQGQELVISNRELTSTRINNYKRMEKRRIAFSIGVEYGTPKKKLEQVNEIMKDVFTHIDLADFDRSHFKNFGDFSLNYEIVYYINSSDYNDYMNVQQEINLSIVEAFEEHDISIAFPTQTIHVHKEQ